MRRVSPRAVFGVPLYNNAKYLPEALDSLLAQSERELAVVVVDDRSTDETPAVAERYARADERLSYVRNETRLGMIGNWRRCFELARERYPEAPYFAWGSDHDRWHPDWLRALLDALEAEPAAVLAYPRSVRIDADGVAVDRGPTPFDTLGVASRGRRLRLVLRDVTAGAMVYGLYRAEALERARVFRHVLTPDRLLLAELALQGTFVQVDDVLWERRFRGIASRDRQRRAFFPQRVPAYAYLPPNLTHLAVLLWTYGARGAGRPEIGRLRGVGLALTFVASVASKERRRRWRKLDKERRRFVKQRRREAHRVRLALRRRARRAVAVLSAQPRRAAHRIVGAYGTRWPGRDAGRR